MPTLNDALDYMGIDYVDAMVNKNAQRALNTAKSVLKGAVGDDVFNLMPDDDRVRELTLMYTDDLYSERGVALKVSAATRKLAADMELQVRLELSRAREAAKNGV